MQTNVLHARTQMRVWRILAQKHTKLVLWKFNVLESNETRPMDHYSSNGDY